ncbi:MAG: hypothetical protein KF821_09155 [Anaerolineales bacterium]|nr:hypothetical protein [Anaerolineales bacterium]
MRLLPDPSIFDEPREPAPEGADGPTRIALTARREADDTPRCEWCGRMLAVTTRRAWCPVCEVQS